MTAIFIIWFVWLFKQRHLKPSTVRSSEAIPPRSNGLPLHQIESCLPEVVRQCRVTMRYYHLLQVIDWSKIPERPPSKSYLQSPTSYVAFIAACFIKLDQGYRYMSQLHDYLLDHPCLLWLLGFTAHLPGQHEEPASLLPTARHFTRLLRKIPNHVLQRVLDETVVLLHKELPDLGISVALDTKHILAWVQENNPKAYTEERFNPEKQPRGDRDCKLGCKRRHNFTVDAENNRATPETNPVPAAHVAVGEYYWGYASGVVATKVAGWGEFVLAEWTQTLDRPDVSYFYPLLEQTEKRLGQRPRYGCFDAAFDAFYVYEYFHQEGQAWQAGFAAVPLTQRGQLERHFDDQGQPVCAANLSMKTRYTYQCHTTLVQHERALYACPIHGIEATCPVDHPKWATGGCQHRLPTSVGARLRHQIDRGSSLYKNIYKQRTATERINAQAVALGIERPQLRNAHAIANLNTLIYCLINLRALHRVRTQKAQHLH